MAQAQDTPMLSVEQILQAQDIQEKVVHVPEWNGTVRIRSFTKAEQQAMRDEATVNGEVDMKRMELLMFVHGVIEPRFTADHVPLLTEKSAGAIDRVTKEILAISGLTEETAAAADKSVSDRS